MPAETLIKAISDHELLSSRGTTSVSQNFLTRQRADRPAQDGEEYKNQRECSHDSPERVGSAPGESLERTVTKQPAKEERRRRQTHLEEDGEDDDHLPAGLIVFGPLEEIFLDHRLLFLMCRYHPCEYPSLDHFADQRQR